MSNLKTKNTKMDRFDKLENDADNKYNEYQLNKGSDKHRMAYEKAQSAFVEFQHEIDPEDEYISDMSFEEYTDYC